MTVPIVRRRFPTVVFPTPKRLATWLIVSPVS